MDIVQIWNTYWGWFVLGLVLLIGIIRHQASKLKSQKKESGEFTDGHLNQEEEDDEDDEDEDIKLKELNQFWK